MSVQTIVGGVVGAIAGFVVGGPMGAVVGAGIGAGIGAMATPQKIQGAKVGEEEVASSQSGTPIAVILGEAGSKGDLLWQSPRKIVKTKEVQEAKGGDTTVENEEVERSYGIHFSESSARKGTKVKSVKIIRRNKIIVYDTRPESKLTAADNAKFMENVTFYFGDADQLADPTYQTHFGSLGAPAYRNQFTMVVKQHLLGKFGNAIPTYECVVCGGDNEGVGGEESGVARFLGLGPATEAFRTLARPLSAEPDWIGTDADATGYNESYPSDAIRYGSNMVLWSGSTTSYCPVSGLTAGIYTTGPTNPGEGEQEGRITAIGTRLWLPSSTDGACYIDSISDTSFQAATGIAHNVIAVLPSGDHSVAITTTGRMYRATGDANFSLVSDIYLPAGIAISEDSADSDGTRILFAGFRYAQSVEYSDDAGSNWSPATVPSEYAMANADTVRFAGEQRWLMGYAGSTPTTCGVLMSTDNGENFLPLTLPCDLRISHAGIAVGSEGRCIVLGIELGTTDYRMFYSDDYATWTEIPLGPTQAVGRIYPVYPENELAPIEPSLTDDDVELPDVPGHYINKFDGSYSGRGTSYLPTPVDDCSMTLAGIIRTLSRRTPVPPSVLDVARVEGKAVRGMAVRAVAPIRTAIDMLAELYLFDVAESGGGVSIVPRGGPVDLTIEDGDLLLSSKEVTKAKRGQQSEFPKIATLRYVDPTQDFEESSQRSVIKSKDFRSTGEKTFTVSVTMMPNEAATQIARIHAEMQDQLEGGIQFALPAKYLAVIPSTVASYLGKRYRVVKRRVEPWKVIIDSAVYDRASTYSLTAEGTVTGHTPTPQSSLVGPTMFAPMNMPVAVDAFDRPCLHAVVQGISPNWRGADIYIKRGSGQYELAVSNIAPGMLGELTVDIDALAAPGIDYAQTLQFKLYAGGEAESITIEQLMEEKNAFALLKPDYTVNVGQFMDTTETAPQTYEATGIAWNRLDTSPASFTAGATIAFLDGVQMIPLRSTDLGQTIYVKAVSRGTAVETAPEHAITLTMLESMREWQPTNVVVTINADRSICVEWDGRARLGSSRMPVHSQNFLDYEVKFDIGSATHIVHTNEQSKCVSAADLTAAFPDGYGTPAVTVRARSKVYVDYDSPPGGPSEPDPGYPYTVTGSIPDGYLGEPYFLNMGLSEEMLNIVAAYAGQYQQLIAGEAVPNVWAAGYAPGQSQLTGVPIVAGTFTTGLLLTASGPLVVGDPVAIAQSVTIGAKPTYAMMDWMRAGSRVYPVDTTPSFTTAYAFGALRSRAGFNGIKAQCEFIVTGLTGTGVDVFIGVSAGSDNSNLSTLAAGHYVFPVTVDGTYLVKVDATVSPANIEVLDSVGAALDTATLSDALSFDGNFRHAWAVGQYSGDPGTAAATIKTNMGNEAWLNSPTGGFGGVPNTIIDVPVGFDVQVGLDNGYLLGGELSQIGVTTRWGSLAYCYAEFGKSTGQWSVGMGAERDGVARIGLCKDGHTGLLGQGADSFGMYYDFSLIGTPMIVIETTWGGTLRIPHPSLTMDTKIIFVCDFDAHTVQIWGKPQYSDYILLETLAGLPSGSWVPGGNYRIQMFTDTSEVAGTTNWVLTL